MESVIEDPALRTTLPPLTNERLSTNVSAPPTVTSPEELLPMVIELKLLPKYEANILAGRDRLPAPEPTPIVVTGV